MSSAGPAPAHAAAPPGRRLERVLAGLVLALTLGLYARTAGHDFVSYDDGAYVSENPHVAGGLTRANVRWAWSEFHSANWHPLTWLSHQLDVELFGLAPGPMHLVNASLHALNAALCFVFLRRATGRRWPSLLVALLFALHPLRVQSVAWIAERKDVLAGTFFFLTLLAYERHARAPSRARLALVALALALGLLAKPMLVTLPGVLLLLDLWPLRRLQGPDGGFARARLGPLLVEKLPLLALVALSAVVTFRAQRAGNAVQSIEVLSLAERVATALQGTCIYLAQTLWPAGLAFFYPHPALVGSDFRPLGLGTALSAGFLLGLSVLAWRLRAREPWWLVGWLWMLGMLVPVVGLVQVGAQFHADRYTYLPLLGPLIALVFDLETRLSPRQARAGFALTLTLLALLAALSVRQIDTWRDMRALAERALAVTERNYVAHEHLALFLQREGDLAGAEREYEAVLAITRLPSSLANLAALRGHLGRAPEAVAGFEEALRLQPDLLNARLAYGLFLERGGDLAGAAAQYELASRAHPDSVTAWRQLGQVRQAQGQSAEAYEALRTAQAAAGGPELALQLALAECASEAGRSQAARAHLESAARLGPADARVLLARAWLHATARDASLRDPARALELLARLEAAGEPPSWRGLRTRAAALAASGRSAEAVRAVAEASALAPPELWETLKAERERYAAGQALER